MEATVTGLVVEQERTNRYREFHTRNNIGTSVETIDLDQIDAFGRMADPLLRKYNDGRCNDALNRPLVAQYYGCLVYVPPESRSSAEAMETWLTTLIGHLEALVGTQYAIKAVLATSFCWYITSDREALWQLEHSGTDTTYKGRVLTVDTRTVRSSLRDPPLDV